MTPAYIEEVFNNVWLYISNKLNKLWISVPSIGCKEYKQI